MPPTHSPRWYTIPIRVALVTFICTLLAFAVSLLLGIIGTVALAAYHHAHPDMRVAYRQVAVPAALAIGAVVIVVSSITEIRHFRRSKTLVGIARVSERSSGKDRMRIAN
ncbi:MAG: hypothetical protein WA252_18180 [Candidatus Sulfotelmatobacter sp.]